MNYIELEKLISGIFPDSAKLDYRTVTLQDIMSEIDSLLMQLGIRSKFNLEEFKYLKGKIGQLHTEICGVPTADQNNIYLKTRVLMMKNLLTEEIMKHTHYPFVDICQDTDFYEDEIGTPEELKELCSKENITNYITELLTFVPLENDIYDNNSVVGYNKSFIIHQLTMSICNHYGIVYVYSYGEPTMDPDFEKFIKYKIDEGMREGTLQEKVKDLVGIIYEYTNKSIRYQKSEIEELLKSEEEEENYDELMEMYSEKEALIKRQKEILQKVGVLDKEKEELLEEYKQNEQKIGKKYVKTQQVDTSNE